MNRQQRSICLVFAAGALVVYMLEGLGYFMALGFVGLAGMCLLSFTVLQVMWEAVRDVRKWLIQRIHND